MKELYLLSVVIAVVLADKLVAAVVANADCKTVVGVVMIIIRRVMTITTGPVLAIQYWPVLHNCHLLFNILC